MTFLQSILERKKQEAKDLPEMTTLSPTEKSMTESLRKMKPALIAEVKPMSPSEGTLMDLTDLPRILRIYNIRAQAISVLCDNATFGGGYDLLSVVRTMTDLPILAKEFIVSEKQIRRARHAGADAILLIAAMLTKQEAQTLAEQADALGMSVLFEIHEEKEILSIPALSSDSLVIGINNRNLKNLKIDLETTKNLAPKIRSLYPEHLLLSESGIRTGSDIATLSLSIDGFLIGTTFLKSSDAKATMAELFPSIS